MTLGARERSVWRVAGELAASFWEFWVENVIAAMLRGVKIYNHGCSCQVLAIGTHDLTLGKMYIGLDKIGMS